MSDIEVVRTALAGWKRGDWSLVTKAFGEDAVWCDHRRPDGEFRGYAGLREAFRSWVGTWEEYASEQDEPIAAREGVVLVEFRERGVGKGSRLRVGREGVHVFRIEGGRITRLDTYGDRDEARRAARI